ncbi:hypothetical protein V8F20_009849 [Naviculisporaceae sp. PSN 640]
MSNKSAQTGRMTVNDEFPDLYEILEVSPFATLDEIRTAVRRKFHENSDPKSDVSLTDRMMNHRLLNIAYQTLCGDFKDKITHDIGRMIAKGELMLRVPAPDPDYPSAQVARLRFMMLERSLEKTLDPLVAAWEDAMDEKFMDETVRGGLSEQLKLAMDQMRVFIAHVTLGLRIADRGIRRIRQMDERAWAHGIRDPTLDKKGRPTKARRLLKELQDLEKLTVGRYWVQIARCLWRCDPGARNGPPYATRLNNILKHVRY